MNGTFVWPLPGLRSYPLRGYLVVLVATVAAVLVSTVLILNRIGTVSNSIYWLAQEDANRALFERYITEVWNIGNLSQVNKLVTADHVHHDATLPEPVSGIYALKQYVQKCRADLPDLTFEIDDLRTEGERMVADLRAVGEGVDVPLTASVRVVDGKLAETWFDVNALVTNAEVQASWELIEAANLELGQKFVEFNQNLDEYMTDRNHFDAALNPLFTSSYRYHGPWSGVGGTYNTLSSDYNWYRAIITAFPDLEWTAESVVVQRNKVYIHYTQTGTFTNPYALSDPNWHTLQPTGKQVIEEGMIIHRVEDGKFVEQWWYPLNPAFWAEMALMFQKDSAVRESVAQEIYDASKPK